MASELGNGLPESEDADTMVARLLSQFNSSTIRQTAPNVPRVEDDIEEVPASEYARIIQHHPPFEIPMPTVDKPSDYEYLPGHFAARRILRIDPTNPQQPMYTVRLQSGEREIMSENLFMQLRDSLRALDRYNEESEDDLVLIRETSNQRKSLLGGDGVTSDGTDTAYSRARRRARQAAAYNSYRIEESDDEESDDDDEIGAISSSDELSQLRRRTRRKLRRGPGRPRRIYPSDESSGYGRSTRVSRRQRKVIRKDLRERYEDDFSEVESDAPRQQKYTGARETFRELSRDDEFRQRHFACCATCNYYEDDVEKGPLVFCQGCTSSYHQYCLGPRSTREHLVTKVGEGDFVLQCRRCLGMSHKRHDVCPHLGRCAVCNEDGPMSQPLRERLTSREEQQLRVANNGVDPVTPVDMARVNNVDNVLFRCASCQRAFHVDHLAPFPGQDGSDVFDQYSVHWQCQDCWDAPGEIEEMVAWRPCKSSLQGPGPFYAESIPEIDKEFLIKWKRKSYFRATWMPGDWVWGSCNQAMLRAFYKSSKSHKPFMTAEEAIHEDKLRVDIVFDVTYIDGCTKADESNPEMVKEAYVKYKGLNYEDSVWETPPKPTETARWVDFKDAFNDWLLRDTIKPPNRNTLKSNLASARERNFENDLVLHAQPEMVTGGELMEYQMDGVNWLYYMFMKQQNAILADDMGLGKTIQIIGLFATLVQRHGCWPFLVVAPNSTVPNWRREIKSWTPNMRVVTYYGSQFSRQMAHSYEMFPHEGTELRCHVVIASYESMVDDEAKRVLSRIHWAGLVVDEGQRLKNDKSQLYERLCRMKFGFKALLTGTPLQNNIRELFNLIQFLDPNKDAEALEEQYGDLNAESIRSLHEMIRPFFLRRTKGEVLPFLPPMVQIIVPVSMSVVQKKLYKSILGKNPQLIQAICKRQTGQLKKAERHNLNNILVQLRKCLCHPFIYNKDIEEQTQDPALAYKHLVEASGKLQLLKLMLPKLRERGHRVLIFSQFLENLDIVEDFLSFLDLKYCRLDGKLTSRQKQHQIDVFNAPDSPYFAFLLSTRSGGVGINLATADTVIIMDPDFNPKQDMQALSRAHRIGQKNTVLVFHMTTRSSVEEKIMQKGKRKLALDHVLIERMEDDEDEEDLESILRHGAAALFEDDESADVHYDSESIDKLLDRSQAEKAAQINKDAASNTEPRFNFARVWQNDRGTLEEITEGEESPEDGDLWEKILREREAEALEEAYRKAEGLGRGKRKRATIDYRTVRDDGANELEDAEPSPVNPRKADDSDVEFRQEDVAEETESPAEITEDEMNIDTPPVNPKVKPFRRAQVPPPFMPVDGVTNHHHPRCRACGQRHPSGSCPLKQAGVEHCPLCGLAHYGKKRACPHLQSTTQVRRMLSALELSQEPPELVEAAQKYCRSLLHNLLALERKKAKEAQPPGSMFSILPRTTSTSTTPVMAASASRNPGMAPFASSRPAMAPSASSRPGISTPPSNNPGMGPSAFNGPVMTPSGSSRPATSTPAFNNPGMARPTSTQPAMQGHAHHVPIRATQPPASVPMTIDLTSPNGTASPPERSRLPRPGQAGASAP